MLPLHMSRNIEFSEYLDANGKSPFAKWFDDLDAIAAAKGRVHRTRVELGNYSNVEPIGEGLSEIKIDFGPGYRVYFRSEIGFLLLLLGGSSKKGQQKAINAANSSTPAIEISKCRPADTIKMLITIKAIRPNSAATKNVRRPLISDLVVYPQRLSPAKLALVARNVVRMLVRV